MAYEIVVSNEAHQDIAAIVAYIANELHNLQAASKFLDDIEQSYHKIANNPFTYSLCSDGRLRRQGYRKVTIKNYLMLYYLDENKDIAYVVRVIYAARDYARLL